MGSMVDLTVDGTGLFTDYTVVSSSVSDFARQMRARPILSSAVVLRPGHNKTLIGEG